MKLTKRKAGGFIALAFCCMGFMGHAAHAQGMGVVDEDKLAEGFKAYREAVSQLDERAKTLDAQLKARVFMNADEGKRFDEIILKDKRSAAEEDALKKLVASADGKRKEYEALVPKAAKTPDESARMLSSQKMQADNEAAYRRIGDALYDTIKKQQDKIDTDHTQRANDAVKDVATARKLAVVVRLKAVIWSDPATDITKDVLAKLNG